MDELFTLIYIFVGAHGEQLTDHEKYILGQAAGIVARIHAGGTVRPS